MRINFSQTNSTCTECPEYTSSSARFCRRRIFACGSRRDRAKRSLGHDVKAAGVAGSSVVVVHGIRWNFNTYTAL